MQILRWSLGRANFESLPTREVENTINAMFLEEGQVSRISDLHLRSRKGMLNCNMRANNGEIGRVDDFLLDTKTWKTKYLVINTQNWLEDVGYTLISPAWIEKIKWNDKLIYLDFCKELVAESPRYNPEVPLELEYERKLFRHYGRRD
jgi:hypothetical protein